MKESEDSLSDVGSRSDGSHLQMSPERCSSGSVAVGDLLVSLLCTEADYNKEPQQRNWPLRSCRLI